MKHQLTHFTRFFPAAALQRSLITWGSYSLWASMAILCILNVAVRLDQKQLTNVLGETTDAKTSATTEQKNQQIARQHYIFWESVVADHPEYRDGYLSLARLGYILNYPEIVSANVQRASQLDPNGKSIQTFRGLTKE